MSDLARRPTTNDSHFTSIYLGWENASPALETDAFSGFFTQFGRNAEEETYSMPPETKFTLLRDAWLGERDELGTVGEMVSCPSYQSIIGMGDSALPLIFRQLEKEGDEPDFWFPALTSITCTDPVPEESRGNLKKMTQAWLAWASRHGLA